MKSLIGWIGAWTCFWIGHGFHKLSYMKKDGKYIFDKPENMRIGIFLAEQYQVWMNRSCLIQDWAGNKRPWRKVK